MLIADLHIHSRYSRATSKDCDPIHLALWASKKGIGLLGTGDFTHPAWREELREKLIPAQEGLYALKEGGQNSFFPGEPPRFIVSGEISCIYKKNGSVRKVHNLILLPGLEEAERLSKRLEQIGNIHSDGRPILGLDSRDLLEITLEACPRAIFIPAHIWTPHFSLFGAFSGFDTIEECFEDLTPHIHALETGLSSNPPMNWRLSALDGYTLVSNSDAHSPQKLGREANLLEIAPSYSAVKEAIEEKKGFLGTIEFFPEEGKYHFDGHRNCHVCLSPEQAEENGGVCPKCGRRLTTGVLHRVCQLADRDEGYRPAGAPVFESLAPLPEVIAASTGYSAAGTKTAALFETMLRKLGPEFSILRDVPLEEITSAAGPAVAEGLSRLRRGQVRRTPGFDGEYGKVELFTQRELDEMNGQISFFPAEPTMPATRQKKRTSALKSKKNLNDFKRAKPAGNPVSSEGLNTEQQKAVETEASAVVVAAGPGTGKTRTLTARIAFLVEKRGVSPAFITAVTFTNQAAAEMRARLEKQLGAGQLRGLKIGTFHSLCLALLTDPLAVADEFDCQKIAEKTVKTLSLEISSRRLLEEISKRKNGLANGFDAGKIPEEAYSAYCLTLEQLHAMDYDDILLHALTKLEQAPPPCRYLLVDEFQDLNGLQYRLIRAMAGKEGQIFAIGDPDQSIYGFRGSHASYFDRFLQEHPGAQKICLRQNYRSTPQILGCALPVLAKGEQELYTVRQNGPNVRVLTAADEFSQAVFIAKEINRMMGGVDMLDAQSIEENRAAGFSDFAVLYRTHRQAEVLEKCLGIESIPYIVKGRDQLLADPAVRGTICFFRALLNPGDFLSSHTCLSALFGCKSTEDKNAPGLQRYQELIRRFGERRNEKPLRILEDWRQEMDLSENKSFERLLHMAVLHGSLSDLLRALTLGKEPDVARCSGKKYASQAVTLSTLHGAKGLEFPVVFLCGVSKGTVPLERPFLQTDPQEERRLLYVGMTRAREELVLLSPGELSPFIKELPQGLYKFGKAKALSETGGRQLSFFS